MFLTERQEACRRADVTVPLSLIDIVDFALGRFFPFTDRNACSNNPLQREAEISEIKMEYGRFVPRLSNVNLDCNTWHSLA